MSRENNGGIPNAIIALLKDEARRLHKSAQANDPKAVKRITEGSPAVALGSPLQRKHALATIAREVGFESWSAAVQCFEGREGSDWAEFLYPKKCHIHWNIWFASYDEAKEVHKTHAGFLLPYKNQFMIVDIDYIQSLGVAERLLLWQKMDRDWVKPPHQKIRDELALIIVEQHLSDAGT